MPDVTIQKLLEWAYNDELPKMVAEGSDAIGTYGGGFWDRFAELGTLVDAGVNGFGVVPDFGINGTPHNDAIKVAEAVSATPSHSIHASLLCPDWPEDHRALVDWEVEGINTASILISCAILRRAPDWQGDLPKRSMVLRSGRPAWFLRSVETCRLTGKQTIIDKDGFNPKSGRPFAGAVRKYQLDDTAKAVLHSRAIYYFWVSALSDLRLLLSESLENHRIMPAGMTFSPWAVPHRQLRAAQS